MENNFCIKSQECALFIKVLKLTHKKNMDICEPRQRNFTRNIRSQITMTQN
jgi:hypothetical protein